MDEKDYIIKATAVDAETTNVSFNGSAEELCIAFGFIVMTMVETLKIHPDDLSEFISDILAKYKTTEGSETK